ncbi:MAG TPA: phage tail sheath subtilisin-like domain-containing protein, partial [Symbiobacteriaceae bacterium]|nr:phage tail sheath subtilisin-like domain-containing protein [Symbiobacteriaceae bacterium]
RTTFKLNPWKDGDTPLTMSDLNVLSGGQLKFDVRILTCSVTVGRLGEFAPDLVYQNLSFHPEHANSILKLFAAAPNDKATALVPLVMDTALTNGAHIAYTLLSLDSITSSPAEPILEKLNDPAASDADRTGRILLAGGSDGERPLSEAYRGDEGTTDGMPTGFKALEALEDISIVAAPGSTFDYEDATYKPEAAQIQRLLIAHAEQMRYRIAVLDSADNHLPSQVRAYRAELSSSHAALYYPWIKVLDPVTRQPIYLPPSGFVAGIYARNDVNIGVHKAPANEVVRSAIGFSIMINKAQHDVLNPEGINCFRYFEGGGLRLWGARTISSDPEWKYVNLRRYFAYLERSIDKGTQWVVFMNNNESLWAKVRSTVESFLFNEWKSERLMGTKPEEAYFVKCDRSTMTQNDLDNGRLICLIGVSAIRPAEFVIFRIGQWTAGAKS